MPTVGRQGTGLLVLEVGPSWERQWVLCTAQMGCWPLQQHQGGCKGPVLVCLGGRGSLWTLPVGALPQPRSDVQGQSSMCTSPCLPPRGSRLLQEGLCAVPDPGPQYTSAVLVTPA